MLARVLATYMLSSMCMAAQPDYGCAKPLDIGVTPFGVLYFHDAAGHAAGFEPDLIAELERRTGCQMITHELSRPLMLSMVRHGKLAIGGATAETPDRAVDMKVMLYGQSRNDMVIKKDMAGAITKPSDMLVTKDFVLGVVKDSKYGEPYDDYILQLRQHGQVREASDTVQLFHWLKLGRVNAVIGHVFEYQPELKNVALLDQVVIRQWAKDRPPIVGGLAFSRKCFTPEQLSNWETLFAAMRREGSVAQLFGHYLDADTVRMISLPN